MPNCCLYKRDSKPTEQRIICTTGSCPTITGYTKIGEWVVGNCFDCKFEEVRFAATTDAGFLSNEINDARVLLAETQGRLAVLGHLGVVPAESPISPQPSVESPTSPQPMQEVSIDITDIVDKEYEEKSLGEIVDAPVSALQGVSESDAELLQQAFNVKTVSDLANLKFVQWAQDIVALAPHQLTVCQYKTLTFNKKVSSCRTNDAPPIVGASCGPGLPFNVTIHGDRSGTGSVTVTFDDGSTQTITAIVS